MKKISARVVIDGNCKACGAEIATTVNLGSLIQVNTGSFFSKKYELFMEAELDMDDRVCPECGYNYFEGTHAQ